MDNWNGTESLREGFSQQEEICEENLSWWCLKAKDGDPDAQYAVAYYMEQQNRALYHHDIMDNLRLAAEQEHKPAMMLLARKCLFTNPDTTVELLTKLAHEGVVEAMWKLAAFYSKGLNQFWYTEAAEQGDGMQKVYLAIRYRQGRGVPKNVVESMNWVYQATMSGILNAEELVMEGKLDPAMEEWDELVQETVEEDDDEDDDEYDYDYMDHEDNCCDAQENSPKASREPKQEPATERTASYVPIDTAPTQNPSEATQKEYRKRTIAWGIFGFILMLWEIIEMVEPEIWWFLIVTLDAIAYMPIGHLLTKGISEPNLIKLRFKISKYVIPALAILCYQVTPIMPWVILVGRFVISYIICMIIDRKRNGKKVGNKLKDLFLMRIGR